MTVCIKMGLICAHVFAWQRDDMIRLAPRFAELATTTNFSFLRGASHPEELVARAADSGLTGIGVADRNSLAGVVRAHVFARENRAAIGALRVVTGARLAFTDGTPDILAYPTDRAAYGRLCRLLTAGNLRAPKGQCHLTLDDLVAHAPGLQIIVMEEASTSSSASSVRTRREDVFRLREIFSGRLWLAAAMTYGVTMRGDLAERVALSRAAKIPLLATNDVLMHVPERRPLADVVACIREGVKIDDAGRLLAANAERHLKDAAEMARLFREAPEALEETIRFLDGLAFSLDELSPSYPEELREGYADPQAALEAFAWEGARRALSLGRPRASREHPAPRTRPHRATRVRALFPHRPRHRALLHARKAFSRQGRGSAANSSVCYCLGITEVDPSQHDLLFARFISAERGEPPDIDVDFEHERREEVIQYIYRRFGREKSGAGGDRHHLSRAVGDPRSRQGLRPLGRYHHALTNTSWGSGSGASTRKTRGAAASIRTIQRSPWRSTSPASLSAFRAIFRNTAAASSSPAIGSTKSFPS